MTTVSPRNLTSKLAGLRDHRAALAVVLLCAVAVAPLLRGVSPCTHDGGLHYHRVVALRQALSDGIVFSRYVPDLAFGYGYPFFNYREILSYYSALALYLTGMGLPVALNLVYVLSIVGSAIGAYLLARDLFGPTAGIVAGVAYAYAPYQFLDALLRGNAPESVALALVPFILWAFRRLALNGGRRYFVLSTVFLVGLYLTHYISSLILTPILIAYMIVLWWAYRRQGHWVAVGGALASALGLSALFLGPALLEQDYVQLHMSIVTRNNDFHFNFADLREILALPRPVDTSLVNPPYQVHLGLVAAILGAIGLVVGLVRWRDRERRATLVFLALLAVALVWMSTASSLWVWESVPLLPFVQFPWRSIGRAILPVALLGSAAFSEPSPASSRKRRPVVIAGATAAIALLIVAAFPYTYPPLGYCPTKPYPTVTAVFAFEQQTGQVGVDPEGSYFPVWVKRRPVGSPLVAQYAAGGPIARFDETSLPERGSIVDAHYGPNRAQLIVESPASFQGRYQVYYFPGWQVRLDGARVTLSPSDPDGLLTFAVPAGRHTVTVRFRETPLRVAADVFSLITLAVFLAVVLRYPARHDGPERPSVSLSGWRDRTGRATWLIAVCLSIALLGLKVGVIDRTDSPFRRPALLDDGCLPSAQNQLGQRFANGLTLIGYDQSEPRIPADGVLQTDLYWTTHSQPTGLFQSVVHLVGPDGLRWSMPDSFRPRGYTDYPPAQSWQPNQYALDSHEVEPLPGAPPGTYDVVLTVFDPVTLAPISVIDDQGHPAMPALMLGTVTLERPVRTVEPAEAATGRFDQVFGPVTLVSAHLDRAEMNAGDAALLTTFWRSDRQPDDDLVARLVLAAPGAPAGVDYVLPLAAPWFPTTSWRAGDVWRGQQMLRVPAAAESGDYELRVAVPLSATPRALPVTVRVSAPPRSFTRPATSNELDVTLGTVATLVGFDALGPAVQPGGSVTVTLVWQALDTPAESYRVFVHLMDGDGRLVAQSDGIPDSWTRPTTGWIAGEYVVDTHSITVPSDTADGTYELRAGMYIPGVGRLKTSSRVDSVPLATLTVVR